MGFLLLLSTISHSLLMSLSLLLSSRDKYKFLFLFEPLKPKQKRLLFHRGSSYSLQFSHSGTLVFKQALSFPVNVRGYSYNSCVLTTPCLYTFTSLSQHLFHPFVGFTECLHLAFHCSCPDLELQLSSQITF